MTEEIVPPRWGGFVYGIVVGTIVALLLVYFLAPQYLMTDCGCGVMAKLAGDMHQCIQGGNVSAPICGAFK